jgi:hypothetical protein
LVGAVVPNRPPFHRQNAEIAEFFYALNQTSKIQNPKSKIKNSKSSSTRHPLPNVRQALEKLAQAKVGSPLQGDRP